MKKQATNPYLSLNEYVPDGEPHVFGDRVYIFGSHDKEDGEVYCMLDYVSYSAPVDDLTNWQYEGIIYRKDQDPHYSDGVYLWAPDVCQGSDGRYYLYYILSNEFEIAVAVCDEPAGRYEYLGRVSYHDGSVLTQNVPFDPAILNDNGRFYLYYGFCPHFPIPRLNGLDQPGASVVELEKDMLTVKGSPNVIIPSKKNAAGTGYEGHAFFEACSIRKINGRYYLVYASELSHELAYAVSDRPDGGFKFGGSVISNAEIGFKGNTFPKNCYANNHGGLALVNDQWYVFYHRHTHAHQCSRQGCAEKIFFNDDGSIDQVQMTSCGLNDGSLDGNGEYSAGYACCLYPEEGGKPLIYGKKLTDVPYIGSEDGTYMICNMSSGSTAVFRYFDLSKTKTISLEIRGCSGSADIMISGKKAASIAAEDCTQFKKYSASVSSSEKQAELSIIYTGCGTIDIRTISFTGESL